MAVTRVVAITGCDSGLGWALAARAAREGLITVAGMYDGTETNAAKALKALSAHPCELDVTSPESVVGFRDYVQRLLKDHPNYRLYAVVNNAGIMTIGDYEWQSTEMIERVVNTNLLGTMRVISQFLPDLRVSALEGSVKPRIINVSSHCGLQPLPGFAPYSASKAGVLALTQALRMEQRPYGLTAVAFIPGGFVGASNLMALQAKSIRSMQEHLSKEQKTFYERTMTSLADYLQPASVNMNFDCLKDENIIETFMKAMNEQYPRELYKVESWRYRFYYSLMRLPLPERFRYWIIKKFIAFPVISN
ncbi:D-beta-hydroxybutyrate dehydrogenase, mitochondrial [Plutella xylostella]|uniref:D-beta-hydroxybutyrate dehydrogenase, mitochondrial n=1 Tax=Plutella xylostella TaxID=51655 RepID=UPI0020329284|nr:D-beta-hydroxybutyrate dehydrogenase, mitochondrial [Plutella xylostella]